MYQLVASITELKTEDQFLYTSKLDTKGALQRLNQMVSWLSFLQRDTELTAQSKLTGG